MNWKVGDIAICDCPNSDYGNVHGMTVTLIQYVGDHYIYRSTGNESTAHNAWLVDTGESREVTVNERNLRKPYDGNEKTEWKTCVFQPKELVVTT